MVARDETRTPPPGVAGAPPDRTQDVAAARRGVASFGGGGDPTVAQSLRSFARRYGWRAYALPILVVVTVVALLTVRNGSTAATPDASGGHGSGPGVVAPSTPPIAASDIPLKSDAPHGRSYNAALKVGALPAGGPYTKHGDGSFRVLPVSGPSKVVGHSANGNVFRYDVEVEKGITGIDTRQFASMVQQVLSDNRSWSGHGVALRRVDSGPIDFHVSLTSAMTVRQFCGYSIPVETSCYVRADAAPGVDVNRVVIDDARWVRGAGPYVGDINAYRTYLINHEDGHAIGHNHAHECLPGGLAPVMMQQTFGLKSAVTGKLCEANPWPYPPGAKGAPGAEQPDTPQNDEYAIFGKAD